MIGQPGRTRVRRNTTAREGRRYRRVRRCFGVIGRFRETRADAVAQARRTRNRADRTFCTPRHFGFGRRVEKASPAAPVGAGSTRPACWQGAGPRHSPRWVHNGDGRRHGNVCDGHERERERKSPTRATESSTAPRVGPRLSGFLGLHGVAEPAARVSNHTGSGHGARGGKPPAGRGPL